MEKYEKKFSKIFFSKGLGPRFPKLWGLVRGVIGLYNPPGRYKGYSKNTLYFFKKRLKKFFF